MLPVQTFYPETELLKKHIAYYYFLQTDSRDFNSTYYAFPNILPAVNLHKATKFTIKGHSVISEGDTSLRFPATTVQGRIEKPLYVQLKGVLDKVTIIFKPLGLNHFISSSFDDVANQPVQLFTEWSDQAIHKDFLESFFDTPDFPQRVKVLETFLLANYRHFKTQEILQRAIDLLSDFEKEISVSCIPKLIGLNDRTFNRLFRKHMGISPVGYRKIARFRHSLKNRLFGAKFKKLTEIGYESNFYDQSYFIKVYNQLAGTNPGNFFRCVDKLADDNLIFKFVKI